MKDDLDALLDDALKDFKEKPIVETNSDFSKCNSKADDTQKSPSSIESDFGLSEEDLKDFEKMLQADGEDGLESFLKAFSGKKDFIGNTDDSSFFDKLVDSILVKDVLYEPMKELSIKYPEYLERNKNSLSSESYDIYSKQCNFVSKIVEVFENNKDDKSLIIKLVDEMNELGDPPAELMKIMCANQDIPEKNNWVFDLD